MSVCHQASRKGVLDREIGLKVGVVAESTVRVKVTG